VITLFPYKFDINKCDQQIQELQHFLTANLAISESGENGLQKFFSERHKVIRKLPITQNHPHQINNSSDL